MSKKAASVSIARQVAALLERPHDAHTEGAREWIDRLQAIRDHIAPLVIACNIREGDAWVMPVVELLGDAHLLDNIQALSERLRKSGQDTTVPAPRADDPRGTEYLENAAVTLGVAWGQAGYLIGLAVGMQLGPHAFDGLAAKGGAR